MAADTIKERKLNVANRYLLENEIMMLAIGAAAGAVAA
jgi:hypothetical protein